MILLIYIYGIYILTIFKEGGLLAAPCTAQGHPAGAAALVASCEGSRDT